jgi:hypothetical protein
MHQMQIRERIAPDSKVRITDHNYTLMLISLLIEHLRTVLKANCISKVSIFINKTRMINRRIFLVLVLRIIYCLKRNGVHISSFINPKQSVIMKNSVVDQLRRVERTDLGDLAAFG